MKRFRQDKAVFLPLVLVVVLYSYLTPASVAHEIASEIVARWIADETVAAVENPINANRRSANRGRRIFAQRCAVCHGDKGAGDGPAGKSISPQAADLTAYEVQDQSDGALYWKIGEGRVAMPAWKAILDDDERWNLVNYIRSLKESEAVESN